MDIRAAVERVFCSSRNQGEVVVGLYRLVFPTNDEFEKIEGFPTVGRELSQFIWPKFVEFDRVHHPEMLAGRLWMNKGFNEDRKLGRGR